MPIRPRKLIAALALALPAVLTMAGCSDSGDANGAGPGGGDARPVSEIQESGSIRIGVFSDKAPFGSVDANGDYVGYDIEYGEQIAEDLGVEVEWVPVEAASRVEFLETGKVDIILANFTVTDERAAKVDFANPYMQVSLGAVSPESAPVTEEGLADAKILIVKGTTADTYLAEHYPDADVQKFEQYNEVTSALADGRGDVWVTDNTEALAFSESTDGYTTSIPSFGDPETIAAAVQKGNTDLLEWLNEELVELGEVDFFHTAYEHTLAPVYGDAISPDEIVIEGGQVD
ncbi:transporter substrate-binding domain-containing protein [Gulosibacter sp. 10]|uniref:transporter substrate-binding domain-containing protein n=1 Tax=Gulosibacter sp. 10 TaxID=1255570 RepID=UPI00097ED292|nr:transporter substrate-binding domain-containing protein [Gulosibacter sp. 10]SJM70156.1 Lysine-arginine-ornithine-binding periplasmic protein precursor (TC 3.A.1.3.1) [Gulosibacter sp. 10]